MQGGSHREYTGGTISRGVQSGNSDHYRWSDVVGTHRPEKHTLPGESLVTESSHDVCLNKGQQVCRGVKMESVGSWHTISPSEPPGQDEFFPENKRRGTYKTRASGSAFSTQQSRDQLFNHLPLCSCAVAQSRDIS